MKQKLWNKILKNCTKMEKLKSEQKLRLSIESLYNFGVYPEIINDMINDLNKLITEKKSEIIAKEHFMAKRDNGLIKTK